MLGQRIVDSFGSFPDLEDTLEDTQEPHCLPEPPAGLTIRRLKSAGLRIVTESDALWPESSKAESALRSAVEVSSAEISPQELQIRALEKATAILGEQARDAQACAIKLRQAVKNQKGLSPEEVKLLQRECWLEERRSSARKDQSAQTRDLLTKLCSPISEVPPGPPLVESPNPMTQREVNLAKFMQLSPTRITFPMHSRSFSTSPVIRDRRQTISRRSKSVDGNHSRRGSNSTDATLVSDESNEQTAVARQAEFNSKPPHSPNLLGLNGVVRIEKTGSPRPRDSLEAEVGDVPLPDYVVGLLEEMVADDVTLPALIIPSSTAPADQFPSPLPLSPSPVFARTSLSMPNFTLFDHDETASRSSTPTSPSPPSRPPSRILDRLRSQPDIRAAATAAATPSAPTPPHPRPTTANAHLRASVTQSLHNPLDSSGGSMFKFSSLRLTSPSLVTVPESDTDLESRPQSSMSGYIFESPETVLERSMALAGESGGRTIKRRFSLRSFRRQRFGSEGHVRIALVEPDVAAHGDEGILARFKRRLTGLR
ncbi:hypothetical protein C8T65DRAFT_695285 [Cerioporus squamosus]|nr:hypothetical protein C8T65DRAFT_695285 [Cerioporus squamosus]